MAEFSQLIDNVILLLALGVLYETFDLYSIKSRWLHSLVIGLLFGSIAVAVMSIPIKMGDGLLFDTRDVVLAICGLFMGWRPALIAAAIALTYRLTLGGDWAFIGLIEILVSTAIGIGCRVWFRARNIPINALTLYFFGVASVAHLFLYLPLFTPGMRQPVLTEILLPVLAIFPFATMLLGLLLKRLLDRRQIQQELANSELLLSRERNLLRSMLDAIPDPILVKNTAGDFLMCNPAFELHTGMLEADLREDTASALLAPKELTQYVDAQKKVVKSGRAMRYTQSMTLPGESTALVETHISPFYDDANVLQGIVVIGRDVTEQRQAQDMIWRQANFDSLTGLPNRSRFLHCLHKVMQQARRSHELAALILIDLDNFKEINDTLGHAAGDLLLCEVSKRLSSAVRQTDVVARLGGDEFVVILEKLPSRAPVERVARNILTELEESLWLNSEQVFAAASLGIAFFPDDASSAESLLKYADQAMYAAKAQGKNRFTYFSPSLQSDAQRRNRLAKDLRQALADNQLEVYYQPIVDFATGSCFKAEALLRWQHPELGVVSPAEFIPIAENTGLIIEIGKTVAQQVTETLQRWRQAIHPAFEISMNVSPVQFRDESACLETCLPLLHTHNLPGCALNLEITESLLMDDSSLVAKHLQLLEQGGVKISLDDFGTGYSSLAYLQRFKIDVLKIDRMFVADIGQQSESLALCEAIVTMAHKLGIKVVAEGVETKYQAELLTQVGCDYAQGYLYAKPLPALEFEQLFAGDKRLSAPAKSAEWPDCTTCMERCEFAPVS